jgi:hypothetical protein
MKLVTDDRCRLASSELFKPNTPYEGELTADGTIRLVELVSKEVPIVRPIRVKGRLRPPEGFKPSRQVVAAAIRADRDAR